MFGRDSNQTSGIPGAGPSTLGGLPGGTVSLGKAPTSPTPGAAPLPPREWELGPVAAFVWIVVVLAAGTFGFVTDWHHRQATDPASTDGNATVSITSSAAFTTPARLTKALGLIASKGPGGGRIAQLSVLPGEVDATMIDSQGLEVDVTVNSALGVSVNETGDGLSGASFAVSRVTAGAPQRILNAAQQRFGASPSDLMTLDLNASSVPGKVGIWNAQYTSGQSVDAALNGTNLRKVAQ